MRLLKSGPVSTLYAHEEGKSVFKRVQDCAPIVEQTKALHNEGMHGSSEMKLAASIPFVLVERYCIDNGVTFQEFCNDQEHIKRMCNDPSLSHFRVWKGAL